MNRRIRSIVWLMALCIIGINAFQGYWLWTTYQFNHQQFMRTMQDALYSVVQQRQIVEANRLFAEQSHTKPPKRVVRAAPVAESYPGAPGTPALVSADTLARQISTMLVIDWAEGTRISLPTLWAAYHAELLERGINANFKLDTVSVHRQKPSDALPIYQPEARPDGNDTPTLENKLFVPVNPVRHLYARASFETPTFYLLRRMGWLLGSSAFLLLLTTGSFLFMLSTILRQKKLSEVKNDFINNMTHELKTPIATVTAAVEALQHFGALTDPEKTRTYLVISRTNLQRLSELVEKVLNLALDDKRELTLRPEPVNLSDLVGELIAGHQLRATKPITFQTTIPPGTTVTVDRIHFGSSLNNLIENAINYSHERVTVRLTFQRSGQGWQLAVADDGIGIPQSYQSAIFDRFFRVPTGDLHLVKGFGLGLASVRQVVERHGGRIQVQSEPGKGSEFTLTFS